MALTQLAMVEELAYLIKDNLYSKHLILSTEEVLINYLQDGSSAGILELKPASSYNRLLLHRLAEIYGFAHESVGEGENRHVILERCSETAIPQLLVGDILLQQDDAYTDTSAAQFVNVAQRECADILDHKPLDELVQKMTVSASIEDRAVAYEAARARIFAMHDEKEELLPKPRSDPIVARRMIAHALGQNLSSPSANPTEASSVTGQIVPPERNNSGKKASLFPGSGASSSNASNKSKKTRETSTAVSREEMSREHAGAAKRMFAHALGLNSGLRNGGSTPTKAK